MPRAEATRKGRARDERRFEIDRRWLWRGALAVALIAFVLLVTKASTMLFGSGNKRLERHERANEQAPASQPVAPKEPPAAREPR